MRRSSRRATRYLGECGGRRSRAATAEGEPAATRERRSEIGPQGSGAGETYLASSRVRLLCRMRFRSDFYAGRTRKRKLSAPPGAVFGSSPLSAFRLAVVGGGLSAGGGEKISSVTRRPAGSELSQGQSVAAVARRAALQVFSVSPPHSPFLFAAYFFLLEAMGVGYFFDDYIRLLLPTPLSSIRGPLPGRPRCTGERRQGEPLPGRCAATAFRPRRVLPGVSELEAHGELSGA